MAISQTRVTGSLKRPDGKPARLVGVKFILDSTDHENGETVLSGAIEAAVDTTNGSFSANVWPNDQGANGTSRYSVEYKFSDGEPIRIPDLYVMHGGSPKTIETIVFESAVATDIAPRSLHVLTQAEFDALVNLEADSVYLVTA